MSTFEEHRGQLRAVAFRMLGSAAEADDILQEAWLRYSRSDTDGVANLGAWLTTVASRLCLDALRARTAQPLVPFVGIASSPEDEAVLTDQVGGALLVVLETLTPTERLAFVLHDMFSVPFAEIAEIIGKSTASAKMAASRARNRVKDASSSTTTDLDRQRRVADAFMAAARAGDFTALVAVLDPDVVLRVDFGKLPTVLQGAEHVARQALLYSAYASHHRPALVNGGVGIVTAPDGKVFSVMAFTIRADRIAAIDILADPERLARLDILL
jgi:RNA polymerase sigma factor (sigma-70 family)